MVSLLLLEDYEYVKLVYLFVLDGLLYTPQLLLMHVLQHRVPFLLAIWLWLFSLIVNAIKFMNMGEVTEHPLAKEGMVSIMGYAE